MLAKDGRVGSMVECRYGVGTTGPNHIIALDKQRVVEIVDGWITYCQQHNLPTWATNGQHWDQGNVHYDQGNVRFPAGKIRVSEDSPLAHADFILSLIHI